MTHPAILDQNGKAIPAAHIAAVKASAMSGGAYTASSSNSLAMADFNPGLGSADGDWLHGRDVAIARIRHLRQNEGWAQSGVKRKNDRVVGGGWRFSSRVDWRTLGIDKDVAQEVSKQIQSAFKSWADDILFRCDTERDLTFGGLQNLNASEYFTQGESLTALRWTNSASADWPWRTSLQILDVDRLSNPNNQTDSDTLRGGVEKNAKGAAIAYHIRNAHPGDYMINTGMDRMTWTREARWTPHGRPRIIHLKAKNRPQQTRAVSAFVAGLSEAKMLSQFKQAELQNATVNAMFAAVLKSNMDPAILRDMNGLSDVEGVHNLRNGFYEQTKPSIAGVKIGHLFPGDDLDFNTAGRATTAFADFQAVFLQSLASSLDLTYEELSMDFSRVNYSSARAAMLVVTRAMITSKAEIQHGFADLVLLAVIEEAIDLGKIELPEGAPTLYEAPSAWLSGRWIGPAQGHVDPVKEKQSSIMGLDAALSTHEDEAALQGLDLEQTLDQLAYERKLFEDRGLTPPSIAAMLNVTAPTDNAAQNQTTP